MVWLLRRCENCGRYTLKRDACIYCGGKLRIPHPAKFSPDDKYAKYRRAMKEVHGEDEGDCYNREVHGDAQKPHIS